MRGLTVVAALCLGASLAHAQDGIYGSFNVGQKFVDMSVLNTSLHDAGYKYEDFINNYFTIGGSGHFILATHFMVGGKGLAIFNEREITKSAPTDTTQLVKMTGGFGLGNIGYAFLGGEKNQFRLYPQVGVGLSTVLLQVKSEFPDSAPSFSQIMDPTNAANDRMTVLQKVGLAVDFCLGLDYFVEFIELKALIPGLTVGPLFHAEAGYTLNPVKMNWMRDVDQLSTWEPDISFKGFYWNVGLGLGLSSTKDK
jgi:hypothetical protein